MTAASVAFVGTIGFVGLVAPHAARALVGDEQRSLLSLQALSGGALLSGASVLAKLFGGGAAGRRRDSARRRAGAVRPCAAPRSREPWMSPTRLVLDNVGVRRGGVPVVRELSTMLQAGGISANCGPNGAGRSTLLHAIAGLLPFTDAIACDGAPPDLAAIGFCRRRSPCGRA